MRVFLAITLLAFAAHAEAPLTLTVETLPPSPKPGDRVWWVARLANTSGHDIQVPSQLKTWLHVYGHFARPDDNSGFGIGGLGYAGDPPEITWIPLARGVVVEVFGEAGDLVPECRGGCPAGTLTVSAMFVPDRPGSVSENRLVPERLSASAYAEVGLPPVQVFEVRDAGLAATIVSAKRIPGGSNVRIRLENKAKAAVWVPRMKFDVDCTVESDEAVAAGHAGMVMNESWSEKDAQRVAAGGSVVVEVGCPDLPKRGTVTVRLGPRGVFVPTANVVPPFVWTGVLETPKFVLKP